MEDSKKAKIRALASVSASLDYLSKKDSKIFFTDTVAPHATQTLDLES